MAWPPMWLSASTTITDAPSSRATTAAGRPVAPEPITTMSASRSQVTGLPTLSTPLASLPLARRLTALPILCEVAAVAYVRRRGQLAMPDIVPTHRLTHEASLKMLAAGVAKADALGCKVSLAVVDQSCRLIGFLMMDGARHFSIITTQ